MSIKVSDRQALPRAGQTRSRVSPIVRIFIALGLIGFVVFSVASMLPPPTPDNMPTSAPAEVASTLTFKAEADAQVEEDNPTANAGTSGDLEVIRANGQSAESYFRFTVSGILGPIQSARLRVYSTTDTAEDGPSLYITDNTWTETEITWDNRPARADSESGDQALVRRYSWVEYDVTPLITGDGTYSFVLAGESEEGLRFSARESSNGPELIITLAPAAPVGQ